MPLRTREGPLHTEEVSMDSPMVLWPIPEERREDVDRLANRSIVYTSSHSAERGPSSPDEL